MPSNLFASISIWALFTVIGYVALLRILWIPKRKYPDPMRSDTVGRCVILLKSLQVCRMRGTIYSNRLTWNVRDESRLCILSGKTTLVTERSSVWNDWYASMWEMIYEPREIGKMASAFCAKICGKLILWSNFAMSRGSRYLFIWDAEIVK